jgi:hypothetical protein
MDSLHLRVSLGVADLKNKEPSHFCPGSVQGQAFAGIEDADLSSSYECDRIYGGCPVPSCIYHSIGYALLEAQSYRQC